MATINFQTLFQLIEAQLHTNSHVYDCEYNWLSKVGLLDYT